MKKLLLPVLALGLILLVSNSHQVKAEPKAHYKHDVVILKPVDTGVGVTDTNGYTFYWDGIKIENSSSSDGAPKFQNSSVPLRTELTDMAEAMAALLDQGYRQIPDTRYFVFVKRSIR